MTTPDSRPIHDVIAGVVMRHRPDLDGLCICDDPVGTRCTGAHVAAAVVAACQQATVEQQAQLTGCDWETVPLVNATCEGDVIRRWSRSRLCGPWREDPS